MTHRGFLFALVLATSALFAWMIRPYLLSLLMAALVAALLQPPFSWLTRRLGGRKGLAAAVLLAVTLLAVVLPLVLFTGVVVSQAAQITERAHPWISGMVAHRSEIERSLFERFPALERLHPYRDQAIAKAADLAKKAGAFVAASLAGVAQGAAGFLLQLFVVMNAILFFLMEGPAVLTRTLGFIPMAEEDKRQLLAEFLSVTRAVLKGTFVVSLIQGALGGAAFAVVGIEGAVFWGCLIAAFAVISGAGTALIWIPAVVWLALADRGLAAAGLTVWFVAVVGGVDNVLKPLLVGRDISMPSLLLLLSTISGVAMFGIVGIVLGPVIAALFLSLWDRYGEKLLSPS